MEKARIAALVLTAVLCTLSFDPALSEHNPVQIRGGAGKVGETTRYRIAVTRAPREIRALGLDLTYDPKVLRYTGSFVRGALVETFEFFNVNEPARGRIRMGGFTVAHKIAAGKGGDLATLTFERIREGDAALKVSRLVDDLAERKDDSGPLGSEEPGR